MLARGGVSHAERAGVAGCGKCDQRSQIIATEVSKQEEGAVRNGCDRKQREAISQDISRGTKPFRS